jgi:putative hydrolase of the HAD superfamily
VVFDLGGVLVQAVRSFVEAHERAGLPFPPPSGPEFEARRAALPRRGTGAIDSERYFTLFASASQGVYTAADVRRISEASLVGEYPGIGSVFDALEAVSVESAALANTNDTHWASLFPQTPDEPKFPTLRRVRHRFASHLLGVEKPDSRAYRHVEHATGHVANCILFFDDRQENVEAARAVGWTAELIDYTGDTTAQLLASLRRHRVVD